LCLLAIGTPAIAAAQEIKLQEALLAQEAKLISAIKVKDKAAIAEMLADETTSITASRGRQTTTTEIVAGLEQVSFTDYKISEPKTISLTPDVAILTYRFSWTGGVTGQEPTTTTVYATSVWRQRDGQWRSVLYQETPITAH
jgi:uncharacterized protein (TIGR02246 family)